MYSLIYALPLLCTGLQCFINKPFCTKLLICRNLPHRNSPTRQRSESKTTCTLYLFRLKQNVLTFTLVYCNRKISSISWQKTIGPNVEYCELVYIHITNTIRTKHCPNRPAFHADSRVCSHPLWLHICKLRLLRVTLSYRLEPYLWKISTVKHCKLLYYLQ